MRSGLELLDISDRFLIAAFSGGLLSKGDPTGASALGQVVEVTWHLRGEAGPRQIPDAKAGLCHVTGSGNNAAVTILKR